MTIHTRETTIGRKFTEDEAAHIERGAVHLMQAKNNKFFSRVDGKQLAFYSVLRIEDVNEEGWRDRTFSLPSQEFKGVDDGISRLFVRFATEEECERFDMPYIPMPTKPTHLKIVKD